MDKKLRSTLVCAVAVLPLFVLLLLLVEALQFWRCPLGTFLAGAKHLLLQNFPLMLCAAALALLLLYAVAGYGPLFRVLGGEAMFGNAAARRKTILSAAVVFVVAGVLGMAMSTASFCLAPSRILVRSWPWQDVRQIRWRDIERVEAACTYSKGWSATLRLYPHKGVIEISHSQIADGIQGIKRALKGLPVEIDTRAVDPNCDVAEKDLLLQLR